MSLYRLTPKAKADLRSIWSYVAADNAEAADRVEEAIYDACLFLAKAPLRGHSRKDLAKLPVRFWTGDPLPQVRDCLRAFGQAVDHHPDLSRSQGCRSGAEAER